MAGSEDGKGFTFSTWNLYPLLSDYDPAWSVGGVAMLKFIEERCSSPESRGVPFDEQHGDLRG